MSTKVKGAVADDELDIAMAELMGYVRVSDEGPREDGVTTYIVYPGKKVLRGVPFKGKYSPNYFYVFASWSPSTDMGAVGLLVEKLAARNQHIYVDADTTPLAVCRAALKFLDAPRAA